MSPANLQALIERAFEDRANVNAATHGDVRDAVGKALELLDSGQARVAEKIEGVEGPASWKVNQWLKKAVLLSFRLNDNAIVEGGPGGATWWDKVPSKFAGWGENRFREAGFRAVPGAIVRHSAFIARDAVLMPSFVNLGAYVGEKTMVDTWVTVGSCAQIGANVHLSGGVGIGGVLEPLQANPTIIEDDCFIGARSEVVEGVIVGKGSVVSMGVFISASTKVIDRATGKVHVGYVPPYSVVVSGSLPGKPLPDGSAGAVALLRGHRQDGRRADPRQDRHQRSPERLMGRASASSTGRAKAPSGPALWARASALPVGVALVMTLVAWAVAPRVPRDLGSQPFFSFTIVAVHAYLMIYGFALIFLAVMQYFVSAKRFTDLGRSPAWAGLAPFCSAGRRRRELVSAAFGRGDAGLGRLSVRRAGARRHHLEHRRTRFHQAAIDAENLTPARTFLEADPRGPRIRPRRHKGVELCSLAPPSPGRPTSRSLSRPSTSRAPRRARCSSR